MLAIDLKLLLGVVLKEVGCPRQSFLHDYVFMGAIVLYWQICADFGPLVDVFSELNGQAKVNSVIFVKNPSRSKQIKLSVKIFQELRDLITFLENSWI